MPRYNLPFPRSKNEASRAMALMDREWKKASQVENKRKRCKQLLRIMNAVRLMQDEAAERAEVEGLSFYERWKMNQIKNIFTSWLRSHGIQR